MDSTKVTDVASSLPDPEYRRLSPACGTTPNLKTCACCPAQFVPSGRKIYCSRRCTKKAECWKRGCLGRDWEVHLASVRKPENYLTCQRCKEVRFVPGASRLRAKGRLNGSLCGPCYRLSVPWGHKLTPAGVIRQKTTDKPPRTHRRRGLDPIKVFERDKWRCKLCGRKTPKAKRGTFGPEAPELDHIIPLSLGGRHTYENTQCACRECNSRKGAKPLGQLLMFG